MSAKKLISVVIFLAVLAVPAFLFQNCGPAVPEQGASDESSEFSGKPFAFEMSVNRLAYMTCDANSNKAFTFKVAAEGSNYGVGLNQEFLQSFNSTHNKEDIIEALQSSEANAGARPQLSIRGRDRPLHMLYSQQGTGSAVNYHNFFSSLIQEEVARQIVELALPYRGTGSRHLSPKKLNYIKNQVGTNNSKYFKAQFLFPPPVIGSP